MFFEIKNKFINNLLICMYKLIVIICVFLNISDINISFLSFRNLFNLKKVHVSLNFVRVKFENFNTHFLLKISQ